MVSVCTFQPDPKISSFLALHSTGTHPQTCPINKLLPDILLQIFSHYLEENPDDSSAVECLDMWVKGVDAWITLVHVCREWRSLAFAYPRHLNLRLVCTYTRRVDSLLDMWPCSLPLVVVDWPRSWDLFMCGEHVDLIIADLEQRDRVCQIKIISRESACDVLNRTIQALRRPYPSLTHLSLRASSAVEFMDPILGGSAPGLRELDLNGILVPSLPTFISSAVELVCLTLWSILGSFHRMKWPLACHLYADCKNFPSASGALNIPVTSSHPHLCPNPV
jgi:hypothetical protein